MQPYSIHSSGFNKDGSVCGLLSVVLSVDKSETSIVSARGNQHIFCLWNKENKLHRHISDLVVKYWNWCSSGCRVITPLAGRPRNHGSTSRTFRPHCPLSLRLSGYQSLFFNFFNWGWVVNTMPRPLYSGMETSYSLQRRLVEFRANLDGSENFAPTGFRSPDRPAHNESLYKLHYPVAVLEGLLVRFLQAVI